MRHIPTFFDSDAVEEQATVASGGWGAAVKTGSAKLREEYALAGEGTVKR